MARTVVRDGAQRDRGDGVLCGLEHAAREVIRGHQTRRTGFIPAFLDERLNQSGDVRDLATAPEPEQVDEMRPDRAEDAAATRRIEPPTPRRIGSLRPAIPAQVGLQRQLHMSQLADRVGSNQLTGAPPVGLIAQFVVNPGEPVGMLLGRCHHLRGLEGIDGHWLFA